MPRAAPATPKSKTAPKRSRQRFEDKRERILSAATDIINQQGAKGMTLQTVAHAVGLNTTSVTYYFARKELLAAAVFERTLARLEGMVIDAASAPRPEARVQRLLQLNVDLCAEVIGGRAEQLSKLSDMRTLDPPLRAPLAKHYQAIFRRVREFWGQPQSEAHKALLTARAHVLLEVVFWLPVWISQYAISDFPHVLRRLLDIVNGGVALPGALWTPRDLAPIAADAADDSAANFLRVATKLINDMGYRGASVDRIAAELNVTKGSFYHHLDAKDDLVLECFRRSYRRLSQVQTQADEAGGDHWQRLTSAIAELLNIQFDATFPLLRTSALQALPESLRTQVVDRSNRAARRFSGTLVDGMAEHAIRIVDPLIASQLIMATLNTAYDLRKWAEGLPREQAVAFYACTLTDGLFNDRVLEMVAAPASKKKRAGGKA